MSGRNAVAFEAADIDELRKPGGYRFVAIDGDRIGINFGCPCGCGKVGQIRFAGKNKGGPEWTITGDWPKATATPSIGFYGYNRPEQGHHWHGFLRAGVFEEC